MNWLVVPCALVMVLSASGEEIDPADFGFSPDAPAATNALALQKALDGGHRTVRVTKPGVYNLDRPVFIDDATDLSFGADVVLQKAKRYSNVLVNRGCLSDGPIRVVSSKGAKVEEVK